MLSQNVFLKLIFIGNLLIALSSCGSKVDAKKIAAISDAEDDTAVWVYDNNHALLGKIVDLDISGDTILVWNSKTQALFNISITGASQPGFDKSCWYESANCSGDCYSPSNFVIPTQVIEGANNVFYQVTKEAPVSKTINSIFGATCHTQAVGPMLVRKVSIYSLPSEISYPIVFPLTFED